MKHERPSNPDAPRTPKPRWVWCASVSPSSKAKHLHYGTRYVATVFPAPRGGRWHWRTCDGKNTQVAGEKPLDLPAAKKAALAWSKGHLRALGELPWERPTQENDERGERETVGT